MLDNYSISKPTISFHQHSKLSKVDEVLKMLEHGKNIALVSDAGTPGVSDPGGILVEAVLKAFGNKVSIIPIPGVSAVTTLASIAGVSMDKFLFMGFPPHKKGRETFFKEIASQKNPVVIYESVHRIKKALDQIDKVVPERQLIVGRELTKQFETIYRGTAQDILQQLTDEQKKGEFVVIIDNK
ncbi:MAG: rRNA (cytidine-2'-O-)-methyltransferase [Candidatus Portnoybacteria bacterium CG10_big_fil_rev_8_21_14_0_10_36_7]|uniref:rRNA (Cytidine-2'-O-)-methyltransferase n=1 Tax=Candidatus Portnoybacteria bacterium CG10_big_fil_rev_8_21_14_0_10_36_7 TaxID=1974812 RepID=A0A2M8KEC5_9BACT|nr:MAG: rRNA (cytidine-2'-O-)-methyltransferase [Candidatus Portnoybacteria bacterium CG10_big_fil_rev_8_21_14_0_10_36_7]